MSEWKLVPVEPTEMMFSATREQYWEAFQADYSAMLAAAPDAPQAEPVFYVHLDGIRAMPPDIFAAWSPTAKQTAHEYRPVFDHPPPDELARLRAENEDVKSLLFTWTKANLPGGWIDDMRKANAFLHLANERLEDDNERLKADSERLEWAMPLLDSEADKHLFIARRNQLVAQIINGHYGRDAIDAAMAQGKV